MKRDIQLILDILAYVRDNANSCDLLLVPNINKLQSNFLHGEHVIHYHVELCVQAGFLSVEETGIDAPGTRISEYGIIDLTWLGHEYLENPPRKKKPRKQMPPEKAGLKR